MKKNMKEKKKISISFIIFLIVIIPIIAVNLNIIIKSKLYPDKIPDVLGYKSFIVLSGSMETEIYSGDLVFTKIIDKTKLKEGDIIAFRNEADMVTTHKIIKIEDDNGVLYYTTKGINNNVEDKEKVLDNEVEGIYLFRIPKLGGILLKAQQPFIIVVIVIGILLFGYTLYNIEDKKRIKEELQEYQKQNEKKD